MKKKTKKRPALKPVLGWGIVSAGKLIPFFETDKSGAKECLAFDNDERVVRVELREVRR